MTRFSRRGAALTSYSAAWALMWGAIALNAYALGLIVGALL